MSEFSTTALLEAQVNQSSLRSARQTVEDELSDIEVDVAATASNGLGAGSGGGAGGSSLATSVLETSNQHLTHISDVGDELAELAQERNHLLRENLEANELAAQSSGGNGGRLPRLSGGLGILGGLAVAIASVNWTGVVTGAIDKISASVGDFLSKGGKAAIDAADLVANKAEVGAKDVISDAAEVSASDVVDSGAEIGEDILVKTGATVATSVLVANGAKVEALDLVDDVLDTTDILGEGFPIKPPDLIEQGGEQTSGSESGSESGSDSGSGSNTGSGGGTGVPEAAVAGFSAFGLNALLSSSSGGLSIGGLASRSAGASTPLLTRSMMPKDEDGNLVGSQFPAEDGKKTNREVILSWLGSGVSAIGADAPGPQPGKVTLAPGANLSGGGVDPSEWETWQERNQDVEGETGTARERTQVSYPESSRGTPDRNETTVESPQIKNEIEVQLDIRNTRQLEEFMRDPERFIERNLNLPGGR